MASNVTDYCDDTIDASAWGTSNDYNDTAINLNSTALSDMTSNDFFILAIVNFDYDYKNIDPPVNVTNKLAHYKASFTGTSRDPKIVTVASGYAHDVSGLAAASIGKINTVATANVGKVNSLD